MSDIAKFEIIQLPKLIAVGKKFRYSHEALDSGDNRLPSFWAKCYAENIFAPLESQAEHVFNGSHAGVFFDWRRDSNFSYIIGLLMKESATIPPGYSSYEIAATDVALIWAKSKDLMETRAVPWGSADEAITASGRSCANMPWCADVFHPSRSTTPNENGETILDCYIPLD
ncbi:MAG: GyrI-like domain-containing protein [Oscillospiraceae bacterium]|nr:GyrI-like domain-containing protein [Oscillospiraceae bacterium]